MPLPFFKYKLTDKTPSMREAFLVPSPQTPSFSTPVPSPEVAQSSGCQLAAGVTIVPGAQEKRVVETIQLWREGVICLGKDGGQLTLSPPLFTWWH